MRHTIALVAVAAALAGCGSITGLTGQTEFACKAPEGVPCTSMSGVYENIRAGNVPGQHAPQPSPASAAKHGQSTPAAAASPREPLSLESPPTVATAAQAQPGAFPRVPPTLLNTPSSGAPIRTPERVLRIWIAPLEDREGTLHDQRYVYVQVERGQWLLQAFQDAGSRVYAPVRRMQSASERQAEEQAANPQQAAQDAARRNAPFVIPGVPPQAPAGAQDARSNEQDRE